MGSASGDLKPDSLDTHARRSPSPRAPSPRAPDDADEASAAGKRSPEIVYRIKTPGQALHDAVSRKDLDGVTRILRVSPDIVDAKNDRGRTPLHGAAQSGQNEIVKLLISKGAEVDARSKWRYTPLHFAAESSRQDVVVTLLDAGADLQAVTRDGLTPLHKAVVKEVKNKEDMLLVLLARGANCNAKDNAGSTPLQTAVALGKLSNARALCAFGADLHLKDKHGDDAFDIAKRLVGGLAGDMADVMSKWEKCGKQTRKILPQLSKFVTKEGRVNASEMLLWLSGNGHEMLVEYLLDYMAKDTLEVIESQGPKGWRPIHHAAWAGQGHVCEILLDHGADVEARTGQNKWGPLHMAAWTGQSHVCETLLARGAAIEGRTGRNKWTPLNMAACKGRQRTLRVLLDHGADILATAELNPPWKVDADSGAQASTLLTKATSFWLAAHGPHPKSLDVLLEYALRIKDDKSHIAAMDDYTKARHHLATLIGQGEKENLGKGDKSKVEPDQEVQAAKSTPSLLPEIDVSVTSGSFDGAFFSVPATSLELSHSDTYQMLLGVWDNFDFKKKYDQPIKIAVLDTGLDVKHQNFQNPRVTRFIGGKPAWASDQEPSQYDRVKACEDFTGDGPIKRKDDMKDLDGHGTQVTELILRLAPRAELYIARICEGEINRGTHTPSASTDNPVKRPRPDIVARAIDWAREQGVDIINMSFGFRDSHKEVKTALNKAVRESRILVFAAMSNDGSNRDHAAWPARDNTIAIGVHSCDHWGKTSPFTPDRVNGSHNFMFVGEKVITMWPEAKGGGFRLDNGTSFATPAVAAMAALILGFAWQHMCRKEREAAGRDVDLEELRELGGMGRVLERVSKRDSFQWYSYVHPQLLWKGLSSGSTDDRSKVRQHAWNVLVESLSL